MANNTVYEIVLVAPRHDFRSVAGWNEACRSSLPNVFGTGPLFGGPTYFSGSTLTRAICNAIDSSTCRAPGDWPVETAHVPLWSYSPEFDQ